MDMTEHSVEVIRRLRFDWACRAKFIHTHVWYLFLVGIAKASSFSNDQIFFRIFSLNWSTISFIHQYSSIYGIDNFWRDEIFVQVLLYPSYVNYFVTITQ